MARLTSKLVIKNNVHVLRAKKRISQQELADAIDVTRATVNAIEGRTYNPSLELAFRLALFFGVGVEEIFSIEGGDHEKRR